MILNWMKWLVPAGIVLLTLAGALMLLRTLAPGLVGVPMDLRLVKVSETRPSFYDGVFSYNQPEQGESFLINDPKVVIRARPFLNDELTLGPHDVLGFRNWQVPVAADVVFIGDSQTYGNNVVLDNNWPSLTADVLKDRQLKFYSMAMGGWGAAQYAEILAHAFQLRPRVVVVAYYTGNDPLDSARAVLANDYFVSLRPSGFDDISNIEMNPAAVDEWPVQFANGTKTVFTPGYRLTSNSSHPMVQYGYGVMQQAAKLMSEAAASRGVTLVTTIIPTKELVYTKLVDQENIDSPDAFRQLVDQEQRYLSQLAESLGAVSHYVDVLTPLQEAAVSGVRLYTETNNGHPDKDGYRIVGETIAGSIQGMLPERLDGLVFFKYGEESVKWIPAVVRDNQAWMTTSRIAQANGWVDGQVANTALMRDRYRFNWNPQLEQINPEIYGPKPSEDN